MNLKKSAGVAFLLGLGLLGSGRLGAQEAEELKSELSVSIFDVNYVRDSVTFHQARQACGDELKTANATKRELLELHPELLPADLEVEAYFGETFENGSQPTGARCYLKFYVFKSGFGLRIFDSPERDKPEQCRPFLEQNRKDHLVFWQTLISGWSVFQGNWCVVRAVEVLAR